jgi:hypothetical protein
MLQLNSIDISHPKLHLSFDSVLYKLRSLNTQFPYLGVSGAEGTAEAISWLMQLLCSRQEQNTYYFHMHMRLSIAVPLASGPTLEEFVRQALIFDSEAKTEAQREAKIATSHAKAAASQDTALSNTAKLLEQVATVQAQLTQVTQALTGAQQQDQETPQANENVTDSYVLGVPSTLKTGKMVKTLINYNLLFHKS